MQPLISKLDIRIVGVAILASILLCGALSGCNKQAGDTEAVSVAETEDVASDAPREAGSQDERYLAFVAEVEQQLGAALVERAAADDFKRGVSARLAAATEHHKKRVATPQEQREERDLWYHETLTEYYTAREFEPLFTKGGRLTPWAAGMLGVFQDTESHAMETADYWAVPLAKLMSDTFALSVTLNRAPGLQFYEREKHALSAWLQAKEWNIEKEETAEKVIELLVSDGAENPIPRIKGAYDLFRFKQGDLTELSVELEVRMADAFTRYVRDMKHKNLNRMTEEERKKYGDEVHPKYHSEIVINRLVKELNGVSSLASIADGKKYLENLWPPHEQYNALREARTRYQYIVDDGGWPVVEALPVKKGGRGANVRLLKERLKAEAYFEGTVDDFFDDDLGDAIALYQETHQMDISGEVDDVFWRSVNITAEARLKEVETNLVRWRDTRFTQSDYYVYINVPDFHAELWKNGNRLMRFKIVAGNTKRECGSNGKWTYPNATPLQHAKLEHLIFNPYWNVPGRIAREEYQPEIAKNSRWLEENGFEFHTDRAGGTVLRQQPGADNALGRVKFIFPNKHNTYMHDTPKTEFFEYPVRAFSHGCMRVEDPMELAETILETESKWDDKTVFGYLKQRDETLVDLDVDIDVFIEYYTVRVDEFGRTHFLADIYKYIRPLTGPQARCNPAAGADKSVVPAGADFGP